MELFYRYFVDDYGILYTTSTSMLLGFLFISGYLLWLYAEEKVKIVPLIISLILITIGLGSVLFMFYAIGYNYQNISAYGTAKQKATVKRCAEKHTKLKEITVDNIDDVMRACRAEENDQKLRDGILQ